MTKKSRFQFIKAMLETDEPTSHAGIYARVSVSSGEDISESITNQIQLAMDRIARDKGLEHVKTYIDDGYTGLNFDRPGFQELLQDLSTGIIDCVIVKDISRIGRNYLQVRDLLQNEFPRLKTRLISISDYYDNVDNPESLLELDIILKTNMHSNTSHDISKKVSSAIDAKMKSGTYLPSSGSAPYGYLRDPVNNTYILDDETWLVVRKIFTMRSKGMNFTAIAKQLNEEGIPCPGKLKYMRGLTQKKACADAIWIRKTIREILNAQVYIGNRVHGKRKTYGQGHTKYALPESDGMVIEDTHPAIVPKEIFARVQKINEQELRKRSAQESRPAIEADNRSIFQKKFFCHDCGKPMKALKSGAKKNSSMSSFAYYDCSGYKESGSMRCSCHYIRDDVLLEKVKRALDAQCDIYLCDATSQRIQQNQVACSNIRNAFLEVSAKKITAEDDYLRDYEAFIGKQITIEEFSQRKTIIRQTLAALKEEEDQLYTEMSALDQTLQFLSSCVQALSEYQASRVITKECVNVLIGKITIDTNRQVNIIFRTAGIS